MSIPELEQKLYALTPSQRAEAIQILTELLSNRGRKITKTSNIMGGDACIETTRIPVWLFVSLHQQGATDADLLKAYPQISAADLVNAWAYAEAYPEEIQTAIQHHEKA